MKCRKSLDSLLNPYFDTLFAAMDEHVSKDIPPATYEECKIVADENEDMKIASDNKPVVSNEER
ncbi:hypothetical protein A0J61_06356 [Choanephora cucurbitarum]|uniref:Uncharacterized protein n=1 Tax=Choanephora cucurbitarum TaxID=101091 RepID=A0A1C7N916_9FUNG|nr:hypothetical protein A0J61_06356 [Choanephora cucurbitarum]